MINIKKITDKSLNFIEKEFGKSNGDVVEMDMEQWHNLRMKCFDIECEEINADGECSERGIIAASLVSLKYSDVKSDI